MPGIRVIDTLMGDLTGLTAAFLIDVGRPTLIETGPGRSVRHVVGALRAHGLGPDDLAYVIVTHVHLDHAGAAGALAADFPSATILVHPAGARHLADPSRLVASAARVHGPLMGSVYGGMVPVPPERIRIVADGARIEVGGARLSILFTPGHANHHMSIMDDTTGTLFPGDAAGLLITPMRQPRPATPPPDFDAEAAQASLRRMRALRPHQMLLTHFGAVEDVDDWWEQAESQLAQWCAFARASPHRADPRLLERALLAAFAKAEGLADSDPRRFEVFGGYAANAAGLSRWASGPAAAAGPGGGSD